MAKKFEYHTILIKGTQNGVFAEFPFDSFKEFGTRKPVPVKVTIDGKQVEMSLLPCGNNKHWLHIRKEIRNAVGKEEGDTVEITVEKNDAPKTIVIPDYLQWLLEDDPAMMKAFNKLPYSAKTSATATIEAVSETKNIAQPRRNVHNGG